MSLTPNYVKLFATDQNFPDKKKVLAKICFKECQTCFRGKIIQVLYLIKNVANHVSNR